MFFSKLKDLTGFSNKGKVSFDIAAIQLDLGNNLFGVMEKSFVSRQNDFNNSSFSEKDVDTIIKSYANKNMLAAAATSIVPGPLGILGSIPELMINMGNQMYMIYDLGCAYNKESFINKDLLLDIPLAAMGGNTNLKELQSSATDLMDSPIKGLKDKAGILSKNMVERVLKKSIVQFVPVAGPILMGIWSKMNTSKIAKSSTSFFNEKGHYSEHFKKEETAEITIELQIQKIKALANLIECNDDINEAQIEFIGPIIEHATISQDRKNYLLEESLKVGSNFELDYQLLKDYEEDENLIFELVVMAKRSGSFDPLEKAYIGEVAKKLAIDDQMLADLIQ